MVQIADHGEVKLQDLGASLFVIRRRVIRGDSWWQVTWRPVLIRVLRFRFQDTPPPSAVTWTKGKGAVGTAWEIGRPVHRFWAPVRTTHASQSLTRQAYEEIPEEMRDGLSYLEFSGIAYKYDEILAVPVVSEDGVTVGVLSIDVAAGDTPPGTEVLVGDAITTPALAAARFAREHLGSLYAQL